MRTQLQAHLKGKVASVANRVYLEFAHQRAVIPYLVIQRVSSTPLQNHFGGSTGLREDVYQVSIWGTHTDRDRAEDEVKRALDGFRGGMGSRRVHVCRVSNLFDQETTPTDASDRFSVRTIVEVTASWSSSARRAS